MNVPHEHLISAYQLLTAPWRWHFRRVRSRVGMAPVMVLFYHRVADRELTPWTITTEQFRKHLDWMQPRFELISLAESQRRIATRCNPRPSVAITFDDGYAENCEFAIPELIRREIPATYFVTLANVLSGDPFPHDRQAGKSAPPNTLDQLREMAASGWIEIGGHTRNHADLGPFTDPDQIDEEVVSPMRELSLLLDHEIRHFAFPFGLRENISDAVINQCRHHGILGVCSAYGGYNFPGDDPYHLQRIHGDNSLTRLRNWLTVDPRKLALIERYHPHYEDVASIRDEVAV